MWLVCAILSAVFAAATSILAKVGIEGVGSNLATAIRTMVVVVMAWIMVADHQPAGRNKRDNAEELAVPVPVRPCHRCVVALLL